MAFGIRGILVADGNQVGSLNGNLSRGTESFGKGFNLVP